MTGKEIWSVWLLLSLSNTFWLNFTESWLTNEGGEVTPSEVTVAEGGILALNCTLTNYAASSLDSSGLYFDVSYGSSSHPVDTIYYKILTSEVLQLFIPNVTKKDEATYKCYMNDSSITGDNTYIGTSTVSICIFPDLKNIVFMSDNMDNMTVSWCPSVPSEDLVIMSLLYWNITNLQNKEGPCPVWADKWNCTCIFCGNHPSGLCLGKDQSFIPFQKYTIKITSTNMRICTTSVVVENYTDWEIVKPGPVSSLTATVLNSTSIFVSWNHERKDYVIFQIFFSSQWGENSTIDVGSDLSVTLTQLTPYTLYSIAVHCKPINGGYWSNYITISTKTMEDVPKVAPELQVGLFRISSCSTSECEVIIFWKFIEEKLQNGVILGYKLRVDPCINKKSSCESVVNGSMTSGGKVFLPSAVDSSVQLVAFTSIGNSPPAYTFFPSYYTDLPNAADQGLYAEYTPNGTGVYFSWNYVHDVSNYTFMYCVGKENDKTKCENSPTVIILPSHQLNFSLDPYSPNDVFSMSLNFKNGTNGLTPNWICLYAYNGLPTEPVILSNTQVTETSVKVVWSAQLCSTSNRVRVLNYTMIVYVESTQSIHWNITLPGDITQQTIEALEPETLYNMTLQAISRSGSGPKATANLSTTVPVQVKNIVIPVVVLVVSLVIIGIIILIIICWKKYRKWQSSISIITPAYHDKDVTSDNNSSADYCESCILLSVPATNNNNDEESSSYQVSNLSMYQTPHIELSDSGGSAESKSTTSTSFSSDENSSPSYAQVGNLSSSAETKLNYDEIGECTKTASSSFMSYPGIDSTSIELQSNELESHSQNSGSELGSGSVPKSSAEKLNFGDTVECTRTTSNSFTPHSVIMKLQNNELESHSQNSGSELGSGSGLCGYSQAMQQESDFSASSYSSSSDDYKRANQCDKFFEPSGPAVCLQDKLVTFDETC